MGFLKGKRARELISFLKAFSVDSFCILVVFVHLLSVAQSVATVFVSL